MRAPLRAYLLGDDGYRVPLLVMLGVSIALLITGLLSAHNSTTGLLELNNSRGQAIGTSLMFALLPAYLLAMMKNFWRRTDTALQSLPLEPGQRAALEARAVDLPKWIAVPVLAAVLWGFEQNSGFVADIFNGLPYEAYDVLYVLCNVLLWTLVALVISWRYHLSRGLSQLGRSLPYDFYRPAAFSRVGRMATTDVLAVAGALVFMPLQSLDAQFRWFNYESGLWVGLFAMALVFFTPLWGFHQSMRASKRERIEELERLLAQTRQDDIANLEVTAAHLERVRGYVTWPLNLKLLGRTLGYVILPPAAWVAAALVEQLLESIG
ncbi:MAG: hypothetical protein AAF513_03000 [Pseudomonadota bacterium]